MKSLFCIHLTDILLLLFLLWIVINQYLVQDGTLSIFNIAEISLCALCYILFRIIPKENLPFYLILFLGLIQSAVSVIQLLGLPHTDYTLYPVTGTFDNPGELGGWLSVSLLSAVIIFNRKTRFKESLSIACVLILCIILLYTFSRASWLACLIGLCYAVWNATRLRILIQLKKKFFLIFTVLVTSLCIACYYAKPCSVQGRFLIWKVSAKMVMDRPMAGLGIDGFRTHYLFYQGDYLEDHPYSNEAFYADNTIYPYNEVIKLIIEQGFIGFLIFTTFFGVEFVKANKNIKLLLIGLFTYSLFSYPSDVLELQCLFFVLFGAASNTPINAFRAWTKPITLCAYCIISALFIISVKGGFHYKLIEENLKEAFSSAQKTKAEQYLSQNYNIIKQSPLLMDLYAQYHNTHHPQSIQTLQIMEDAIHIAPTSELLCDIGDYYSRHADSIQAIRYYNKASIVLPVA